MKRVIINTCLTCSKILNLLLVHLWFCTFHLMSQNYTGCSGSNWHTLNRFYGRLNGFLGYSMVPIMFTTLWHFVFYLTFPKKVQRGAQIELWIYRKMNFFENFFIVYYAPKWPKKGILEQKCENLFWNFLKFLKAQLSPPLNIFLGKLGRKQNVIMWWTW